MSTLKQRILDRTVTLGVVGLGYVGLPLAVEKAQRFESDPKYAENGLFSKKSLPTK